MVARNPRRDAASRRAVSERLRRFFDHLTTQLTAGTAEFWRAVERRRGEKSPDTQSGGDAAPAPGFPPSMRQRQSKAKPEDGK